MKKKRWDVFLLWGSMLKIIRVMKLVSFFLLVGLLQVTANIYSQTANIYLSMKETALIDVIKEIQKQTEFTFFYSPEDVNGIIISEVELEKSSLEKVLDLCLKGTNLEYEIVHKAVILKKVLEIKPIINYPKVPTEQQPQKKELKGKVTDSKGEPIPGTTVLVKGTTIGTITDGDGNFTIQVPNDVKTLVFSFVGFNSTEVPIAGKTSFNVSMEEMTFGIDEVVAVGYGTIKKSDITGSVASVKAEDLTVYPALDAIQALQGLAAGVQVQSKNGEPGSGYNISIRGNTSINASSEPLIVVDGFPGATMPPPEDIEAMEILKDASSTAIYGSRGANGVVLITTKSGKKGTFKIDLSSSLSFQQQINRLEVLNATEYATYINEIDPGYYNTPSSYGEGTDWQDVVYRDGLLKNHQLSVSGGTDKVTYYLSGNFYDHEGIIIGSQYKRYSVTSNIKAQVLDWVNVGANIFARRTELDGVRSQTGGYHNASVPDGALKFSPTVKIYNEDGTYTVTDRGLPADNPYTTAMAIQNERITDMVQGNFFAELDLLKDLKFKSTFGVNSASGRRGQFYPSTTYRGGSVDGEADLDYSKHLDLASENYFTYHSNFNDMHDLTVMAGYSYQSSVDDGISIGGATGFTTDAFSFWNIGAATNTPTFDSEITKTELASFYGRLNYGFKSKYLFTFNARYDGSSRFAKNKKWAFFPSGAFAWNVKDESFLAGVKDLNQLKLRVSYGITGNQAIQPYQSLSTLTDVFVTQGSNIIPGIKPGTISNPNLSWESTAQTNIGLDMGLFESRLTVTADYYKMITSDLLFNVPVPKFSGFSTQLQNIGEVQNSGFEFSVGAKILTGELKWNSNANISFNRNEILKLVENETEGNDIYYSTAPVEGAGGIQTQILREGLPVGSFFGFVWDGVLQEGETPLDNAETGGGAEKHKDITPDGILDDNDRTVIGNPHPDFIWGWNNNLIYHNFDLNIFVQGVQGADMIDYTRMELGIMNGRLNATKDALNRWTPSNTNTDIPRAQLGRPHVFSDRWVEDASYIRLKNISLGYNLSKSLISRIKLRSARIYVSAQNILTITNYKGVDPEVAYSSSNKNLGLDYASYPNTKSVTVGVNLGF